jgi:folate-dependent phosphoribosylglycinamide formyltransferase PurN
MVDQGVDTGAVIAQAVVPVMPADTVQTLHERIQRAEHALLPRVIAAIARGEIELGTPVRVHAAPGPETTFFSLPEPTASTADSGLQSD